MIISRLETDCRFCQEIVDARMIIANAINNENDENALVLYQMTMKLAGVYRFVLYTLLPAYEKWCH